MKKNNFSPLLLSEIKAYASLEEASKIIHSFLTKQTTQYKLCFIVPITYVQPLFTQFAEKNVSFCAEMMMSINENDFTQSVAIKLLKEINVDFVLIASQSERKLIDLTAEMIIQKISEADSNAITPILCINDSWSEFANGESKQVLLNQLAPILRALDENQREKLYILYEAGWINRAPWEGTNQELAKGYCTFQEVVHELTKDFENLTLNLLFAVPVYSPDLVTIVKSLVPAAGYSLGPLSFDHALSIPRLEEIVQENQQIAVDVNPNDFDAPLSKEEENRLPTQASESSKEIVNPTINEDEDDEETNPSYTIFEDKPSIAEVPPILLPEIELSETTPSMIEELDEVVEKKKPKKRVAKPRVKKENDPLEEDHENSLDSNERTDE